jgi:hypothetical protein
MSGAQRHAIVDDSVGNAAVFPQTPSQQAVLPPRMRSGLYLACLYVFVLLPIVRADRLYNDDVKRSLFGRTGWDSNGRPLTTLLMKVLQCYDHALVDISPFTQLAAVAVLVWTGVLVARRFCRLSPVAAALVVFPLGAQPFFLENLSYKFDALSMSLAMLAALAPFIFPGNERRTWWMGVGSLFVCLNLYQPALNAFLVFVLLEATMGLLAERTPRELMGCVRSRVGQVLIGGLGYEALVGIHVNGWVKQKSVPISSLDQLPRIGSNASHFLQYVGNSFNYHWWMYFGPLLMVLAVVPVFIGMRYTMRLRKSRPWWFVGAFMLISLLLPFAACAAALGPLLLLADPPIQARILVGGGPLLSAGLIIFAAAIPVWRLSVRWVFLAGGMFATGFSIVASAYGNASAGQKAFEDHIARQISDDLADIDARHPVNAVLLDGSAGYAPVTAHVVDEFPIMTSLIPLYLDASDEFHPHMFLLHFLPAFVDLRLNKTASGAERNASLLNEVCSSQPSHVRRAYRMYVENDVAIVLLGSASERCLIRSVDSP